MATAGIVLGWIGVVGTGLVVLSVIALTALGENAEVSFEQTGDAIEGAGDPRPGSNDDGISETSNPASSLPAGASDRGSYGSDPALDRLYDECEAGNFASCDKLYMDSPTGSEYEAFGDSCGDRNIPSGFCVDIYGE